VSLIQQPVLPLNISVLHQPVPQLPLYSMCLSYSSLCCLWTCLWSSLSYTSPVLQPELPLDVFVLQQSVLSLDVSVQQTVLPAVIGYTAAYMLPLDVSFLQQPALCCLWKYLF